jgi:hypothetical protein
MRLKEGQAASVCYLSVTKTIVGPNCSTFIDLFRIVEGDVAIIII